SSILLISSLSFHASGALGPLPSFPTRRSSDLPDDLVGIAMMEALALELDRALGDVPALGAQQSRDRLERGGLAGAVGPEEGDDRSEEHTSELQSRVDLVCRLLLEKKKNED